MAKAKKEKEAESVVKVEHSVEKKQFNMLSAMWVILLVAIIAGLVHLSQQAYGAAMK